MPPAYVLRSDDFVKFFSSNFLLVAHCLLKYLFQPFQAVPVEAGRWPIKSCKLLKDRRKYGK